MSRTASAANAELLFTPEPSRWAPLVRTPPADDAILRFRAQLGLPTDRPIIASGHQAGFWHCGILAKRVALDAVSLASGAAPAWLLVDHDANDAGVLRLPLETEDEGVAARVVSLAESKSGVPTGLAKLAGVPSDVPQLEGLAGDTLAGAIHQHIETRLGTLGMRGVSAVRSLELDQTDLFKAILDRFREDPDACRATYNRAVDGVRPLGPGELPLWVIEGGLRRAATDEDLEAEGIRVAPRALLMTGLMRAAGCDLFIHGSGGGASAGMTEDEGYDVQTEAWFASYFEGLPPLAEAVVATATVLLPFEAGGVPSEEELKKAHWLARSAAHNPELLGEEDLAEKKKSFVDRAAAMKEAGENPGPVFAEMQAMLADYRKRRAGDLAALERDAAQLDARAATRELIEDRTWPFIVFDDATLRSLIEDISELFRDPS